MAKKFLKTIISTGVIAASVLALSGCATKSAANKGNTADSTIKIGVNMELSGAVAGYGEQEKQGVELAVKQINAAGGIKVGNSKKKITAIYRDNKSSTSGAASVAAQLANSDKAVAIVGPATTNDGTASIPNVTKAGVPMVGPSATDPNFTLQKNGSVQKYVFRACFTDAFQGEKAAVFANDTLKAKNIAIIADNSTDYGTGLAKAFKKKFAGKVVATEYYQSGDKDFNAMLTNIKNKKIDAIYAPGYYSELGLVIKQARQAGIKVPIIGADGMADPKLAKIAGAENATDIYYTTPFSTLSANRSSLVKNFLANYKKQYNANAPTFSALAYDSVYMIKQAIEDQKSADSASIAKGLAKIKNMPGVTGTTTIDSKHNPEKPIAVEELTQGKITKAYTVK